MPSLNHAYEIEDIRQIKKIK